MKNKCSIDPDNSQRDLDRDIFDRKWRLRKVLIKLLLALKRFKKRQVLS